VASDTFMGIAVDDPLCEAGVVMACLGCGSWWGAMPAAIALPLLVIGLIVLVIGARRAASLARVARNGRDTEARVTGTQHFWPCRLTYVFRHPGGQEIVGRRFLSKEDSLRWRAGDTGKVRYDRDDPARHVWLARDPEEVLLEALGKPHPQLDPGARAELARAAREIGDPDLARKLLGEASEQAPVQAPSRPPITSAMLKRQVVFGGAGELYTAVIIGVGLLLALGMLARLQSLVPPIFIVGGGIVVAVAACAIQLVRKARRNLERRRNVLQRGIVTQGSVTGIHEAQMKRGFFSQSLGWDIYYSYKDRLGGLHMGQSGRLSRKEALRYRVGDACEVVFDPDEPDSSFWISRDQ